MFEEPQEPPEQFEAAEGPVPDAANADALDMAKGDDSSTDSPSAESEQKREAEFDPLAELEKTQVLLQRVEAARIVALLNGYRMAMDDAVGMFGPHGDDRDGACARSFLLEAAQVLRLSERGAAHLLDTAHAVRGNLPRTWSILAAGRTTWRAVELVWRQAQGLDQDRFADYDDAAVDLVEATPLPRLKERLHKARERLQAGTAGPRRRAAERDRRVTVEPAADGMGYLTLYGPAPDLIAIDEALTKAAVAAHGVEGEARCLPALRYDIARDLLTEGIAQPSPSRSGVRVVRHRGVRPTVHVTVPVLTALGRSEEPATLMGYGPIDIETALELAGQAGSWIRILTDPVTGVRLAMDRKVYAPPPGLRRWLRVRDETCRAPGCGKSAWLCDVDHVHPWGWDGRSNDDNLAHLCRRHHRAEGQRVLAHRARRRRPDAVGLALGAPVRHRSGGAEARGDPAAAGRGGAVRPAEIGLRNAVRHRPGRRRGVASSHDEVPHLLPQRRHGRHGGGAARGGRRGPCRHR